MNRVLLIAEVVCASYTVFSTGVAVLVATAWKVRLTDRDRAQSAARANRLLLLRLLPAMTSVVLIVGLVLPAYFAFEPARQDEIAGPVLAALAGLAAALVGDSLLTAARSIAMTRRLNRAWLHSAGPLVVDPPIGVPSFAVDSCAPLVALVGVWRPKLVAARSVIAACSPQDLARIVSHEMGHLRARDNLKRVVLACAPDILRWTATHGQVATAWHDAAEDAADDAATSGQPLARVELAALLVKVARLAPRALRDVAAVSPFVAPDELDRRVRRLVEDDAPPRPSAWNTMVPATAIGLGLAAVACRFSPTVLRSLHAGVEWLVAVGR